MTALIDKNMKLENELLHIKHEYAKVAHECETNRQMLNKLHLKPDPHIYNESEESKVAIANLKKEIELLKTVIEEQNHEIDDLSSSNKINKHN